ncbi:MAG: amidohydrolase family protein [Candidatus Dormibacteraeota bacterium]|nr:amidohydrolase family protein [Candidatus Dormibacteraeota bacterium]
MLTALELRSVFTEAIDPRIAHDHVPHTAAYHDALRRLAEELGCEAQEEAILAARNAAEPSRHARRLLERSRTSVLLLDGGFTGGESFRIEEHADATGIPVREIIRLETLAEGLVGESASPQDWFSRVRQALREAVTGGAVGVKSICAYRASLWLRPVQADHLQIAFTQLRAATQPRISGDTVCHALLFEAARECRVLDVPLQLHCGFGDPDEDLAEASPLGLRPLFNDPAYTGLRVMLLHCYPFHREAAYLCSVFPDVYMDLSLTIPMAGLEGSRAMREVLGLCPWSKLLYATDATRLPEVYLVAARAHRDALADAFSELIERRVLSRDAALGAGRQVLAGNARSVYRLPS